MEHISITGDYQDGCEASVCFDMDMNQRGKVSSPLWYDFRILVLTLLWAW